MICTAHQVLSGSSYQSNQGGDGWGMWHAWGRKGDTHGFGGETSWKETIW